MLRRRVSIIACALLFGPQVFSADGAGVNAIYERMSAAYGELDSQAFRDIYAEDATYLRSDRNPMLTDVEAIIGNFERYFSSVRGENGRLELLFRVVKRDCTESLCSDVGWYKLNRYGGDGEIAGTSYGRFLTTPGLGDDGMWRFIADVDTGAEAVHWDSATEVPGLHFVRE